MKFKLWTFGPIDSVNIMIWRKGRVSVFEEDKILFSYNRVLHRELRLSHSLFITISRSKRLMVTKIKSETLSSWIPANGIRQMISNDICLNCIHWALREAQCDRNLPIARTSLWSDTQCRIWTVRRQCDTLCAERRRGRVFISRTDSPVRLRKSIGRFANTSVNRDK